MNEKNIVLSIFSTKPVAGLLENHARYAEKSKYLHVMMDSTHIYGERQRVLYKWHAIYHQLVNSRDGVLVLLLDQFAVIYGGQDLTDISTGYDMLVATQDKDSGLPATSMMVFRNSPSMREDVRKLLLRVAQWTAHIEGYGDLPEPFIVKDFFTPHPFQCLLHNGFIPSAQASWDNGCSVEFIFNSNPRPFVVHNSPQWKLINEQWLTNPDFDFRYVSLIVAEAASLDTEVSLVAKYFEQPAIDSANWELHLNPDAEIAFVSLYTPNISHYGRIHEENISRYCLRHGYGYHLYRDNPAFLPDGLNANWAKVHLIQRHLHEHEFVFWIDADILAVNQEIRIDTRIEGRNFICGTDHAAWAINTCMFGAKNTPGMHKVIDHLCAGIMQAADRSTIYAGGGDQQAIQEGLQSLNMLNGEHVVDAMTLAVSPIYATSDSMMVHFPAQLNHNRAATMDLWSSRSK